MKLMTYGLKLLLKKSISFVYHPNQHIVIIMKNILNMLDKVDAEEKDKLGDLIFDYKPYESLNSNPLYHIENTYGYTRMITEIIRTTITTESSNEQFAKIDIGITQE